MLRRLLAWLNSERMSGCINAVCRGKEIRAVAAARGSVDSAPGLQREGLTDPLGYREISFMGHPGCHSRNERGEVEKR